MRGAAPTARSSRRCPGEKAPAAPWGGSRRRLWIATLAGAALGAAGCWAGASWGRVAYRAVGYVEIASTGNLRHLSDSDRDREHAALDAFLNEQIAVLTSRRVADAARSSEAWRTLAASRAPREDVLTDDHLDVSRAGGGFIAVAFRGEDPDAAATAVNEVLAAYVPLIREQEELFTATTLSDLEAQRAALETRHSELRRAADGGESEDIAHVGSQIEYVTQWIGQIRGGRVPRRPNGARIAARAERQVAPETDTRPRLAAILGAAGFVVGVGAALRLRTPAPPGPR